MSSFTNQLKYKGGAVFVGKCDIIIAMMFLNIKTMEILK